MSISNEESEFMEVDHEGPVENQQGHKRTLKDEMSLNETDVPIVSTIEPLPDKRKILKAKRKVQFSYILVIDTNVLIEDLNTLKLLIQEDGKKRFNNIQKFIIPWTVINELDCLKNSEKIGQKARTAIKFINEQLKSGENNVICMNKNQEMNMISDELPKSSNDDLILQCCLSLFSKKNQNKSDSSSSLITRNLDKIILVTNDINLQNKSIIHKIESCSLQEFMHKYLDDSFKTTFNLKPISKFISNSSLEKTNKQEPNETKQSFKKFKKSPNIPQSVSSQEPSSSSQSSSSMNSNEYKDESKSEIELKCLLENRLSKFIVGVFKETFGESLWRKVLGKKYPIENASLIDSLQVIKHNWLGTFSDYFKRDKKILNLLESMRSLQKNRNIDNYQKLLNQIDLASKKLNEPN